MNLSLVQYLHMIKTECLYRGASHSSFLYAGINDVTF